MLEKLRGRKDVEEQGGSTMNGEVLGQSSQVQCSAMLKIG
jgi:hypothetical protein